MHDIIIRDINNANDVTAATASNRPIFACGYIIYAKFQQEIKLKKVGF